MKSVFVLYTCDNWHSRSSMSCIGVFTSFEILLKELKKNSKKTSGKKLSEDDERNLRMINQTQGHKEDYEYFIEVMELNAIV